MTDFIFNICKWIILLAAILLIVSACYGWLTGGDPYGLALDVFYQVKSFLGFDQPPPAKPAEVLPQ